MNWIERTFQTLRSDKKKAFIPFITGGFPSEKDTVELALQLAKNGADILELGIPFSDPVADGRTIQATSQYALEHGTTPLSVLRIADKIRAKSQIPIAILTYLNPVYNTGFKDFFGLAKRSGVNAVIIPDLPPDDARNLPRIARSYGIDTVFLVAPTSSEERLKEVAKVATGFIYAVSVTGVTGERKNLHAGIRRVVADLKQITKTPIAVGFGISNPTQAYDISRYSDGVIVGSSLLKILLSHKAKKKAAKQKMIALASSIAKAVHS
jgi:tryptophan synthase alpha chain